MNKRAAETSASGDDERHAKRVHKKCSTNNCTNFAQAGGVCMRQVLHKNFADMKDVANMLKMEEFVLNMAQRSTYTIAKLKDAQTKYLCRKHLTLKRKHDDASVVSDDSDSDDNSIDGGNARRARQRLESNNQNVYTPRINNSGRCEDDLPIEEENNNNAAVNNMDSAAGASDFGGDDNGGTFDDDETPNPLSPAVPNTNTNLREEPTPNNNEGNHDAIYAGDLDNEDPPHTTHMEHSDSAVEDEIETQGVER